MKGLKISKQVFTCTRSLLDGYTDINMPPMDYLSLNQNKYFIEEEDYESIVETFLVILQRRQFLIDVLKYFYCLGKKKDCSNQNSLIILIHLIVSVLNKGNKNAIIDVLHTENLKNATDLLKFFNRKLIEKELFLAGCQYFEENYVLQNIILNMRENKTLLQEIMALFKDELSLTKKISQHKITVPVSPRLSINFRPPPPPCNTPMTPTLPTPKPVPLSTYAPPKIGIMLKSLQEESKRQSLQTLACSKAAFSKLTDSVKYVKHHSCSEHKVEPVVQARRISRVDIKSNVHIRKNVATILREASRVMKEEEKEIQRVNNLIRGAANYMKYEDLLEQIKANEEKVQLEELERRHLQGLLTREEAILAKQALLEANKAQRAQFDLEKKETEEALKQMRRNHEIKMKAMIEKTHQIHKNIAEKKKNIISERHKIAQEVTETNKQLNEAAIIKNKEELEKRVEIIKEIKAIGRLKEFEGIKFDPTETMNLGLLSEMSLTELHERLQINRASLEEEITNRQNCIRKKKQKHKQFLVETQQFIESCRQQKKSMNNITAVKKRLNKTEKESTDIIQLREKLQEARLKRLELQKNKC